ncbi:MAG: NAD(P)/FAD-dependent oxidoreductase [Agathobacter sp.]|nr:NAD(P)/FAD-dependent oxidoreductase [Agathobacter sp.]
MSKVVVVGGGAAGMMAAYQAAKNGHKVILVDKNEKLGKKIYITGKGRCNLTNAGELEVIFNNIMTNRKFLYSALYSFTNDDVINFFENNGMKTKIERGNRVFPVSDHSSDVISTVAKALRKNKVDIRLFTPVKDLIITNDKACGVLLENGEKIMCDSVIIATGGLSYPSTGSTGDGYRFAKDSGHTINKCEPSLVPMNIKEEWVKELQGLSLRNVNVRIINGKKKLYNELGEMLFTHFGVSGPLILSASAMINRKYFDENLKIIIDLKPALDVEQLNKRILRDFEEELNKQFKNSLNKLLPSKLVPVVINLSGIDPDKQVNTITKEERQKLAYLLKNLEISFNGFRGWNEAIITKGGISVKDINPSTMESKIVSNLYFCGEVLDLDALTGGYNLQIAWSTGYLAGDSVR